MSLKPFTYPFPETRFLHAGPNVYKFKIRYGNSIRGEEIQDKEVIVQELEHLFPDKSRWERVAHLKFKHGEIVLVPYPFVFTLYVEMKWIHEDLSPGKPVNDCPLGLVLPERTAAGAMLRKRKRGQVPSSPGRPGLDRAKMGTSSQDSSKKKPPMETRRVPDLEIQTLEDKKWERTDEWSRSETDCHAHSFFFPPLLELHFYADPALNVQRTTLHQVFRVLCPLDGHQSYFRL
ncbi:membrane-anchored junction protein isoform X5 [Equus caballus]|uniref:membrane-anchored junction protein isoform X5 n=1 Tax=Equus caballus TaxID=9796 RepID=UPI0038B301EC